FSRDSISDRGIADGEYERLRTLMTDRNGAGRSIRARTVAIGGRFGWMGNTLLVQNPALRTVTRTDNNFRHAAVIRRNSEHETHGHETAHRECEADQQIQIAAHSRSISPFGARIPTPT